MINIYPCDFVWPQTQTQDPQELEYGDYTIQQINDYIMNDLQVGSQVYIYADQQRQQLLENQYSVSQYGLQQDCALFVYMASTQQNQLISITMTIDDQNPQELQLDPNCTVQSIIDYFQEQGQNLSDIVFLDLQDQNGESLGSDVNIYFASFPQIQNFNLKLYTKPQQPSQQGFVNKIDQAKGLLKQLIVFPKLSILVDQDGEFVVFKYHYPVRINGFLSKSKGKQQNIDESLYDFKDLNKIKYAQTEEYGLLINWGDNKYSKVRIAQQG